MTPGGWLITLLVTGSALLVAWLGHAVLLPFVAGLVLAYITNPLVELQVRLGVPRSLASALPVALALVVLGVLMALALPLLMDQVAGFLQRLPAYLNELQNSVIPPRMAKLLNLKAIQGDTVMKFIASAGSDSASWLLANLKQIYSSAVAAFNIVMLVVMTPLVAFYLLNDWPELKPRMLRVLPRRWRSTMVQMVEDIDIKLSAYLRGQVLVCLILAVFYGAALELVGLELGWALGVLAGLLAFIPVVGAMIGVMAMLAMVLVQYQLDAWQPYALVMGIYMVGQMLESSLLTPYLVGSRVGLHPVWVIFVLLLGGELGGITGMLLAVPVGVVVSVLMPYVIDAWHRTVR
ncbi:MAG: AI-2E family transporter [Pseudomonadaceae bacterium]|nr:AI-2E family transporter [Pseudomonadaceae bacterium]